jgi:fucose permease
MVQVFEYSPQQVGTVLMVVGLLSAVVQGGITGTLTKRLGESVLIKASLLGTAVGFFLMLGAYNMMTVLLTVGFLWSVIRFCVRLCRH